MKIACSNIQVKDKTKEKQKQCYRKLLTKKELKYQTQLK